MVLPRLYPIVDVHSLSARKIELDGFVRDLLDGGVRILQLRDKSSPPQEILRRAEIITAAIAGTDCVAVMNDRVDLALLAGWDAVHLGHKDMPAEAARLVSSLKPLKIGVSTHTGQQVIAADAGSSDYIAIGPVYGTTTKADAEPVVGLEGVRRARALTRKPLVAIGGITPENAAAVIEAGADSVAVIGGLFSGAESTVTVVRDFLRRLR